MEKRYQVFVSSTYYDLEKERQAISKALLRVKCFPAGMELFPAANQEQFDFIKDVIKECDYHIVVSAGRYGSIDKTNSLSYTELEYDYAVTLGKPIVRFLHTDPFKYLKGEFIDLDENKRELLENFRRKLMDGNLVKFWKTTEQLESEVVYALLELQRRHPDGGWVRSQSDEKVSSRFLDEISTLNDEKRFFERKIQSLSAEIDLYKEAFGALPDGALKKGVGTTEWDMWKSGNEDN